MSLHLRSATGDRDIRFVPKTRINTSWRTGIIPVPAAAAKIVARDDNPDEWFAFREPREVGRFSFYADKLVRKGSFLCLLGLICLLPAFLWSAVSAIKALRHT
jgi:hypothetical protein